jgi:glyoxylase-like metal-dependent hydrolase (beta-lactamase superfamily II)
MRAVLTVMSAAIGVMASAGVVLAQAPPAGPGNAPFPAWQTEKVSDDLYVIFGEGGNTTALLTDEGVVLVDVKFDRNHDEIQKRVNALTDKPVKYVFNTHSHGDHTGGNAGFAPSATIIAHRNARAAMVEGKQPGLPQVSYTDAITVTLGGKEVVGRYFGRAHTNGDTWVYFPAQKVLATGDSFNNGLGNGGTGGFFGLFIAPGGSIIDMTKTLDEVLKLDFEMVVPGHGPLATRAHVVKWRAEAEAVRNRIRGMVRDGQSKEDITKMLIDEFRWDPKGIIVARSIDTLIRELSQ